MAQLRLSQPVILYSLFLSFYFSPEATVTSSWMWVVGRWDSRWQPLRAVNVPVAHRGKEPFKLYWTFSKMSYPEMDLCLCIKMQPPLLVKFWKFEKKKSFLIVYHRLWRHRLLPCPVQKDFSVLMIFILLQMQNICFWHIIFVPSSRNRCKNKMFPSLCPSGAHLQVCRRRSFRNIL